MHVLEENIDAPSVSLGRNCKHMENNIKNIDHTLNLLMHLTRVAHVTPLQMLPAR